MYILREKDFILAFAVPAGVVIVFNLYVFAKSFRFLDFRFFNGTERDGTGRDGTGQDKTNLKQLSIYIVTTRFTTVPFKLLHI